jgi:hypothetical protein
MKFHFKNLAAFALITLLFAGFTGCKKKEDDIVRIQSIVPQRIIDKLRAQGMTINEGTKPPTINDAYAISPFKLKAQHGPDDNYDLGEVINDLFFKFYEQNDVNEIKYDYYNTGKSDQGTGNGAFIAGDGKKFTIFSEDEGVSNGVPYKNVTIISGKIAKDGIEDFEYAFVLKEKTGDEDNQVLISVDKSRIWIDGDYFSETINNFRISAENGNAAPVKGKSMLSVK